jgi:hypothetical protein
MPNMNERERDNNCILYKTNPIELPVSGSQKPVESSRNSTTGTAKFIYSFSFLSLSLLSILSYLTFITTILNHAI